MNIVKPVLIAVLVILTIIIIIKANRFATAGTPEAPQAPQKKPRRASSPRDLQYYLIYVGKRCPVDHYPFTIGSRSDNDLVITDKTVSRRHAEIIMKGNRVVLHDLGSLNGTKVNGTPRTEFPISGGEKIQLGETILTVDRAYDNEVNDETQFIRR